MHKFSKNLGVPQNSRHQNDAMKQVPYSTKSRKNETRVEDPQILGTTIHSHPGELVPQICATLHYILLCFSQLHGTTLKLITSLQHIYFVCNKYIYKLMHKFQNFSNLEYTYERKHIVSRKPVTVL